MSSHRVNEETDMSFDLASSNVSYLKMYSSVLESLPDVTPGGSTLNTDVTDYSANTSSVDSCANLHDQFSDMKIPTEVPLIEHGQQISQNFVQSFPQDNMVGMLNVANVTNVSDLTEGLQMVGSIQVPISSAIPDAQAYAPSPIQTDLLQQNGEVRINSNIQNGFGSLTQITTQDLLTIPVHVPTKTTDSGNVYMLSMTVEEPEDQVIMQEEGKIEKKGNTDVELNPLETITTSPVPQQESTPNITDDHLGMMNETIIAGFTSTGNLQFKKRTPEKFQPKYPVILEVNEQPKTEV